MGSDLASARSNADFHISIHAPTWGATPVLWPFHFLYKISIHAPTWGATDYTALTILQKVHFNPRSHMGSDQCGLYIRYWCNNFNPRSHMGSDAIQIASAAVAGISIHAPTWGATLCSRALQKATIISIHAPTWGATFYGGDYAKHSEFQSTLPHGERHSQIHLHSRLLRISIHAPTWGATQKKLESLMAV